MNKRDGWLKSESSVDGGYVFNTALGQLAVFNDSVDDEGKWAFRFVIAESVREADVYETKYRYTLRDAKLNAIRHLESRISRTMRKLIKSRRELG